MAGRVPAKPCETNEAHLEVLCSTWVTLLMMLDVTLPLGTGMSISPIIYGEGSSVGDGRRVSVLTF